MFDSMPAGTGQNPGENPGQKGVMKKIKKWQGLYSIALQQFRMFIHKDKSETINIKNSFCYFPLLLVRLISKLIFVQVNPVNIITISSPTVIEPVGVRSITACTEA